MAVTEDGVIRTYTIWRNPDLAVYPASAEAMALSVIPVHLAMGDSTTQLAVVRLERQAREVAAEDLVEEADKGEARAREVLQTTQCFHSPRTVLRGSMAHPAAWAEREAPATPERLAEVA